MTVSNVVALSKRSHPALMVSVRRDDHIVIGRLLAEGRLTAKTFVFDARNDERHSDLASELLAGGRSIWLDPRVAEAALPGGQTDSHRRLPWFSWATRRTRFSAQDISQYASSVAAFAVARDFTAILVPTRLQQERSFESFAEDCAVAEAMREALDRDGHRATRLVFPLVATSTVLANKGYRDQLIRRLEVLPVDEILFRIHPFGKNSGPIALRRVLELLTDFQRVQKPLVVDRAGYLGPLLFSLGVTDRIEFGVASGETFDAARMLRPPAGSFSGQYQGIYLEALRTTVDTKTAGKLLSVNLGRSRYGCTDLSCCPRGAKSMLEDRRRHSVLAQQRLADDLSAVPPTQRAGYYLDRILAPAGDMLFRAGEIVPALQSAHRRVVSIKETVKDWVATSRAPRANPDPKHSSTSGSRILPFRPTNTTGKVES